MAPEKSDFEELLIEPYIRSRVRLWLIGGRFQNGTQESRGRIEGFGGYFYQDKVLGNKILGGRLSDFLGVSVISQGGEIFPEERIKFIKRYETVVRKYEGNERKFEYEMRYDANRRLWLGTYKLIKNSENDVTFGGRVNAIITCMDKD